MKKNFKLVLALVLAAMMIASMIPAMAHTITVTSGDTHTYKVYQVLKGTLAAAGDQALGNPVWGDNAKSDAGNVSDFITDITTAGLTERQIADKVIAKVDLTSTEKGSVSDGHPLADLPSGYYVLVDATNFATDSDNDGHPDFEGDTKSLHVVKVVNDINGFTVKYNTTTVDKEITGDTLGTATTTNPRNPDAADTDNVSIGDTVQFKMTATVPARATDYDRFFFVLWDKMDPGLTFNSNTSDVKVYWQTGDDTSTKTLLTDNTDYDFDNVATDAYTFRIGLRNAKSLAGKKIIVEYSAVLNENAKIGEESNDNTSKVIYSNDPHHNYDGDKDNENPGFPDSTKTVPTGETPTDKTETYTTAIQLKKVDENGKVLTGAGFTITGDSTEIVLVSSETFAEKTDGAYYGLNNGRYTTEAPVTADRMEAAAAGATKGWVEAEAGYEGTDAKVVGSKTYRPYKPTEDSGKTIYILVEKNDDEYDGKRYEKTITYTQKNTKTSGVTATQAVGDDGVVIFRGLGAGTYTITETTTPNGYNTLPAFNLKIDFRATPNTTDSDTTNDYHWSVGTNSKDGWQYDNTDGTFKITVVNNKGTQLPSTGGIGTTIFYIGGSVLVLAAAILLITKRRMSNND